MTVERRTAFIRILFLYQYTDMNPYGRTRLSRIASSSGSDFNENSQQPSEISHSSENGEERGKNREHFSAGEAGYGAESRKSEFMITADKNKHRTGSATLPCVLRILFFDAVVRCFFRDLDVMRMAFPQSRRGDL